jgi:HEAT repeat protein
VSQGPVVMPFLAQVARDPFELTRRAVARIIRDIGHPSGIPIAIDLLMDDDSFARETAAEALRSITGTDLGYQPYASHESRYKAQQRWRQWWEENSVHVGR